MKIYIAAPLSPELAKELETFLGQARSLPDPTALRDKASDLIIRMTNECLDHYYLRGVEKLGLGMIARQATSLGLKSASAGIALFVRRIAGSLDAGQVRKMADLMEELILEVPPED